MIRYRCAGWRLFAAENRAHRDTRAAYQALVGRYRQLLDALNAAESGPCPMCSELTRERDNALHDLEGARLDLDAQRETVAWLERIGWGAAK